MSQILDLLGVRFGQFRVVGRQASDVRPNGRQGNTRWWLRCSCGKAKSVETVHITHANVRCCRCGQTSRYTGPGAVLPVEAAPREPELSLAERLRAATW